MVVKCCLMSRLLGSSSLCLGMLVEVGICRCWGTNGKKGMLGLDGGSCQALLVIPLLICMSVYKFISF